MIPENKRAKSLLHDIYANYGIDYDKALEISTPWASSTVFEEKVEYIADNIKTKRYETARTYARGLRGANSCTCNREKMHSAISCIVYISIRGKF